MKIVTTAFYLLCHNLDLHSAGCWESLVHFHQRTNTPAQRPGTVSARSFHLVCTEEHKRLTERCQLDQEPVVDAADMAYTTLKKIFCQ